MLLWRLSGRQHAHAFDGGYGVSFDGRWNTVGHAVTYCATSPSLCVLEKLVHIEAPALLPELVMVLYEAPDPLEIETVALADLPPDWRRREGLTQHRGDAWFRRGAAPLLRAPSAVSPLPASPDVSVLVNNAHPAARDIRIRMLEPFVLDARLF